MYDDVIYKGRFIWNRLKAEANRKKHPGMTFEKGSEAYDDPLAVDEYDEENSTDEDRFNRTGIAGDTYMTLVLDKDTIITESGRIFHPAHKGLLESLPPDMTQELARRRLEDINRIKDKKINKGA